MVTVYLLCILENDTSSHTSHAGGQQIKSNYEKKKWLKNYDQDKGVVPDQTFCTPDCHSL